MDTHLNMPNDPAPTIEERRLRLDEERLNLEKSFAKKWFSTFATVTVAFVAGVFGFVQQQVTIRASQQANIEAKARNELEWGFKVLELYLNKRDSFDIRKNPEEATKNLQALAAVAPLAVKGVLNAELSRLPPPETAGNDEARLNTLAAVAGVQQAIATAQPSAPAAPAVQPSSFTIYVQYPEGQGETAEKVRTLLAQRGYHAPGMERVAKVPERLEVRYYRPEQRAAAEALAREVAAAIGQPPEAAAAKLLKSSKPLPSGIMEVWLPRAS
jgi:hypothetical protein